MLNLEIHPFMMGIGWGIGYQVSQKLQPELLSNKKFNSIFLILFLVAWFGSKFFFLLSTNFEPALNSNFWLGGGYVFYGGLIFVTLTLLILSKTQKVNVSFYDFLIPGVCFGHAIGRIGCFVAGCCFGLHHIPVQLIESAFLMYLGYKFYKRKKQELRILYSYLLSYAIFRFLIEFMRGDSDRGYFGYFSTSQWISIIIIVLVCSIKYLKLNNKNIG